MIRAYFLFLTNWCKLFLWLICHIGESRVMGVARNLVLLVLMPLMLVLFHIHWLGFLLDEILFLGYRKIPIRQPVFILGVPRSGTTYLQRTLSRDTQFTTTTLEECLFAPSITQRYVLSWFKRLFSPVTRRLFQNKNSFTQSMDHIHSLGLEEPEEDFLLLLPVLSSFIQMVVFPSNPRCWRLAYFDKELPEREREVILNFYYKMVQRHLYFHGRDKILLSKNPSFTSLTGSLKHYFPDSTIIACVRSPEETVPSQISSLKPAFDLLRYDIADTQFQQSVSKMLAHYYALIEEYSGIENTLYVLDIGDLKSRLYDCVQSLYGKGGYSLSSEMEQFYQQEAERNLAYQSAHQYARESHPENHFVDFDQFWPMSGRSRLLSNAAEG